MKASSPISAAGLILAALGLSVLAHQHRISHPTTTPEPNVIDSGRQGAVDVNHADADELQRLPRIGPSLARRILEDRARHGPYETLDDLTRVRGIGARTVEQIRETARAGPAPRRPKETAPRRPNETTRSER